MEFTIPTTKSEMYETLREIYQHYHFRQLLYDGITLEELSINRLSFDELSGEEISEKARQLLSADHIREKRKASDEIDARLISLKEKLASSSATEETLVKSAEENFDKAILSIKKAVYETGTALTSSAQKKIKDAELKKVEEINQIRSTESKLREELRSEIAKEEQRKKDLDQYFIKLHQADVDAKALLLFDEQNKMIREIQKYNNGLDEKEARYRNSLKSNIANLELRYLSIHEQGFAHDELVEMGYYNDVIACVTGYYNALNAQSAYVDIKDEQKLLIYLDSYYPTLVQTYKIRSATDGL